MSQQSETNTIIAPLLDGAMLTKEDALWLLNHGDDTLIRNAAHTMRLHKNDSKEVSYTGFRVINYTNICKIGCSYCSFIQSKGYTLTLDEIREKVLETKALGMDQIFFQGGVNSGIPLTYYLEALSMMTEELGMRVRGLSAVEIFHLSKKNNIPIPSLLDELLAAGLTSVPGAGAEILTPHMREVLSPRKLSAEQWCDVMGMCHEKGLYGSANIVFGSVEEPQELIEHFDVIRNQQDKTGGFLAFTSWTFQQQTKDFIVKNVDNERYLKIVALSRLFFDNINNIEVSLMVRGTEVGKDALHSGANDISSYVVEENVLESYAPRSAAESEKVICEAGYTPVYRNFDYER
ncbi:MAG: radical SAM protein [Fibrobacterales bacterium]